jgi:hypothetical protein
LGLLAEAPIFLTIFCQDPKLGDTAWEGLLAEAPYIPNHFLPGPQNRWFWAILGVGFDTLSKALTGLSGILPSIWPDMAKPSKKGLKRVVF